MKSRICTLVTSLNLDIPGGVNITTPSFKTLNPTRNDTTASESSSYGFSARAYSLKIRTVGTQAEAVGVAIKTSGVVLGKMALKKTAVGTRIVNVGADLAKSGVCIMLSNFVSIG